MADVGGPSSPSGAQSAVANQASERGNAAAGQVAAQGATAADQATAQGTAATGQAGAVGQQAAAVSNVPDTTKLGVALAAGMGTSMAAGLAASKLGSVASSALLGSAASGVLGSVASTAIGGVASVATGTVASAVGSQLGTAIAGPAGGILGGLPASQKIPGVSDIAAQSAGALAGSAIPGVGGQLAASVASTGVSTVASALKSQPPAPAVTRGTPDPIPSPSQPADEQSESDSIQKLLFDFTSLGLPESTSVLSFRGEEKLSHLYSFELNLHVPGDDGLFLDLDGAVGKLASLELMDEVMETRTNIHGMIAELELVEALDEGSLYRALMVPRLWRLGQGRHSRIFVDQKFPDILVKVLEHAGFTSEDYELRLRGSYSTLEHVCQYKESDLAFLSRWMEREGIYYFFEQGQLREKLIIVDQASVHAKLKCGPKRYFPQRGKDASPIEAFRSFRWTRSMQASGVRVADYNYLTPDFPLAHEESAPGGAQGAVVSLFGENVGREPDAKRLAKVRAEGIKAQQTVYRGEGRVYDLRPGYRFTLDEHPKLDFRKELLVTGIYHQGAQLEQGGEGFGELSMSHGGPTDYNVVVTAIPADVQYRPPCVTSIPRIDGLESAVVDGPVDDEYAQIDEHGRYHVKIHFDESDLKDGRASTRVRMLQPHGGSQEGFHFPLRKRTEVMLAFMGGHPDRPVIVGVGPNTCTPSPVTQQNATQNVIQTGGLNRLTMEDVKGGQHIDLECPVERSSLHLGAHEGARKHNLILTTDGNGLIHTGGDRNITVGGNQTEEIQKDLTENYHGNQTTLVSQKREETVDGLVRQTFNSGLNQSVTSCGVVRNVSGGETETIKGGRILTVHGDSKETINGMVVQSATAGIRIKTPARFDVEAVAGVTIKSNANVDIVAPNLKKSTFGLLGEWTPFKQTITGYQQSVVGVGVSLTGVKFDRTEFICKNNPIEFDWRGIKAKKTVVNTINIYIII